LPDSNLKLYAVMLGGMAKGCNIELHDVQFIIADKIENGYRHLIDKWFGIKTKVHLDSYIHLDIVDGYKIRLSAEPSSSKEKLFFINMGAYSEGKFLELHDSTFLIDTSKISVKKRAKAELLIGKNTVHTDDLFEVDDCINISKIGDLYIHLEKTNETSSLTPVNGYHPIPKHILKEYEH